MLEEAAQRWHPTHVQVTVLQALRLHPKGKHGTNDAYTIIQLGKEKYCTSVVEKSLCPVWKEEAAFELPGLLPDLQPPEQCRLQLSVMHRSLVGPDKFLGQASVSISAIYASRQRRATQWYKLESKQGKRQKERGELEVSIHFTRNHMTASMYDLSMKSRSPFARLKGKMRGRKADVTDTSSAIISSASQLPSVPDHPAKSKPTKPFLLGPQRLSCAHSMSDLIGPPGSGPAISSAQENGGLKSPHRRTMSADTAKDDQSEGGEARASGAPVEAVPSAGIPQKFATLPRQWAPGDERSEAWGMPVTKPSGRKKDKVSLFERVTGKKDAKRRSQDLTDGQLSSYEPTNPFLPEPRSYSRAPLEAGIPAPVGGSMHPTLHGTQEEGGGLYSHLTRAEVERELLKHKELLRRKDGHIRELEDYIDNLLVRVMEETPSILRVPYVPSHRTASKLHHS